MSHSAQEWYHVFESKNIVMLNVGEQITDFDKTTCYQRLGLNMRPRHKGFKVQNIVFQGTYSVLILSFIVRSASGFHNQW